MKIYGFPWSLCECFLTERLCWANLSFIEEDRPASMSLLTLCLISSRSSQCWIRDVDYRCVRKSSNPKDQRALSPSTPVHGGAPDPAAAAGGVSGPRECRGPRDCWPRHLHQHVGRPHRRGSWGGRKNRTQTRFHQSREGEWERFFIKDLSPVLCRHICVCGDNAEWGCKASFTLLLSSRRKTHLHKHTPPHVHKSLLNESSSCRDVLRLSPFTSLRRRCVGCDWRN